MAISVTNAHYESDDVIGAVTRVRHPEFTLGTYATSGVASLKQASGLSNISYASFTPMTTASMAYFLRYDYANDKIIVADSSGTQTANATDLSAIKFLALVHGT